MQCELSSIELDGIIGSESYVFVNVLLDVHNELVSRGHSILCFCVFWELSMIEKLSIGQRVLRFCGCFVSYL